MRGRKLRPSDDLANVEGQNPRKVDVVIDDQDRQSLRAGPNGVVATWTRISNGAHLPSDRLRALNAYLRIGSEHLLDELVE